MSKWWVSLLLMALVARENPFEPSRNVGQTALGDEVPDYFRYVNVNLPSTARILTKVTLTYKTLDASTHTESVDVNQRIDWHYPIKVTQQAAILGKQGKIFRVGAFDFWIHENKLYLHTAHKIQRSFVLINPYRIVLDTDRDEQDFRQKVQVDEKYVNNIAIETHDNFYRFSIVLDGQYQYKIEQKNDYLVIDLH
ncbi:AMIN domain-containing protein [Helicobacter sp. NHP22-001]|uniref:AMIN domain-containing protein n=1 Tax=Helicobacter sp. NHP22-001 TaxID=3040202 RepID=UPI00244D8477|nr:AMIN domain-containing protein [Helicobacter sp. NHP22-001]GMB96237.1 AMIN domain-containing protein [Helicobacter sp. NHP22-001]